MLKKRYSVKLIIVLVWALPLVFLSACGGDGAGATLGRSATAPVTSSNNICSAESQKTWVRSYLDDIYLWYADIIDLGEGNYSNPVDYFYALLVKSKDRFSFVLPQSEADSFFESGDLIGYGLNLVRDSQNKIRVIYSDPGSPADQQNIQRGAEIVGINGVPLALVSAEDFSAALNPSVVNYTTVLNIMDANSSVQRNVQLTSSTITLTPVLKSTIISTMGGEKIGYIVFNEHIQTAEQALINSLTGFSVEGITDLVLDMRYNGGGYLYIAKNLASMIGGTTVQGKVFEKLRFNDKQPELNNDPNSVLTFGDVSSEGQVLPKLNLSRVFVLTGPQTCSASESIINSLKPFINVIQIGATTCGKPYGFFQQNSCNLSYFAIEFEGLNALGQGGYSSGIAPRCFAADDLDHPLGSSSERLLAAALSYRQTGSCPTGIASAKVRQDIDSLSSKETDSRIESLFRKPLHENRILKKYY